MQKEKTFILLVTRLVWFSASILNQRGVIIFWQEEMRLKRHLSLKKCSQEKRKEEVHEGQSDWIFCKPTDMLIDTFYLFVCFFRKSSVFLSSNHSSTLSKKLLSLHLDDSLLNRVDISLPNISERYQKKHEACHPNKAAIHFESSNWSF